MTDSRTHENSHLLLSPVITMLKIQEQAVEKAVIDLRNPEATADLTFVCLNRTKRPVDLLVENSPNWAKTLL